MPPPRRTRTAALSAAAALGWLSCPAPPPSPGPGSPSVVLYLVDTLRPDHLGVYGYSRATSPHLDALARDAVLFEQAYAPSSWTRPATASLLTGLSPWRHGARERSDAIPAELELLSETLQAAGYATLAFVTNPNVLGVWGFDQGFDHFEDVAAASRAARADQLIDRVLEQLDTLPPEKPFFLYVHALDPHEPYAPPSGWAERFAGPGRRDVALYDAEIAFGDHHFGRLLARLRETGRYDDALIVFVSDHGEEFEEHGGRGHGHTLFEESVRIPLLVKLPGDARAGERVRRAVTLMDVAPTILRVVGQPLPGELDGIDLLAVPPAEDPGRPLFFDLQLDWPRGRTETVRAARLGARKYLRRLSPTAEERLFDLGVDPGEQVDLRRREPERAARLAALLDEHVADPLQGVHVRILHSEWGEERRCRVRIETDGRFTGLAPRGLEPGDRAALDAAGSSLDLDVALRNRRNPTPEGPRMLVDEDALSFAVEPPDAAIELVTLPDGARAPCDVWLGPARARLEGARLRFDTRRRDLALRDAGALARAGGGRAAAPSGIHVAVVPSAERAAEVPEEARARLRELGYLE